MLRSLKIAALISVALFVSVLFDTSGIAAREPAESPSSKTEMGKEASRSAPAHAPVQKAIDPAAWGSSHAGKPVPDFVHGDECLFCHRNDIGQGWQKNAHGVTVRQSEDPPEWRDIFKGQTALATIAPQVGYFLGCRHRLR